jgi:hypothetical protein
MDDLPFALGGYVSGVLHAPPLTASAESFEITLSCSEVSESGDSTFRTPLWREEISVDAAGLERAASGVQIPIAIPVPAVGQETNDTATRRIVWSLAVSASLPGPDYEASFELPVFKVEGRTAAPPRRLSVARTTAGRGLTRPPTSKIREERSPDALAFQFPAPSWLLGWTFGPLLLVPIAAGIGLLAYPGDSIALAVAAGIGAVLAGLLLGLTALGLLTQPNRIEIRNDTVVVRRGVFGRGWDRRIPRRDIVRVAQAPVQNGPRVDYVVNIETRDGKTYTAALGLRRQAEAKWLAFEIGRAVGLPSDAA